MRFPDPPGPARRWSTRLLGGGALALHAKALDFQVVAADAAPRSVAIAQALIANSRVRLRRADIAGILTAATPDGAAAAFTPRVFTPGQSALLNGLLAAAPPRWRSRAGAWSCCWA